MEKLPEIWMSGDFTAESALKLRKDILEVAEIGEDVPVVIYINSYGGSVDALNKVLDLLDSLPNRIITVCSGTAMSAGAVLLSYGDERYIGANSRVMIHQVSSGTFGTVTDMEASVKETKKLNNRFLATLAKKCKKTPRQMKAIFEKNVDKYLTPQEAKKFGLVDKTGTPRLKQVVSYELE